MSTTRLAERLERAHEHRVAEHLADRAQALLLVFRRVDVHLAPCGGEEERVAQGAQEVLGDPAGVVARLEQSGQPGERAGDVFGGDRIEDADAGVERRAAEHGLDPGRGERAGGVGEGLVEQRLGVTGGARGGAGDGRERLGLELDALALEQRPRAAR